MKRCCTSDRVGMGKSEPKVAAEEKIIEAPNVDVGAATKPNTKTAEEVANTAEDKIPSPMERARAIEANAINEAASDGPSSDHNPSALETPLAENSPEVKDEGAAGAINTDEATAAGQDSFDQLVDMLTAMVLSDAIEEVQQTIRNTNFHNFKRLETLVKFGEDAANHVLKEVMHSLREEFTVKEDFREELEKTVPGAEGEAGEKKTSGDVSKMVGENDGVSPSATTDVHPDDLCDVIVEECSDSSRSSSSSSSSDESSSPDDDDEDSGESSEDPDRARDAVPVEAIPALFEGSLKIDDKVVVKSSSTTEAAAKFSPSEMENVLDQYFEPVCRRCRDLRSLLLEVDEDVEADAMEFHFTLQQLGDKTGPPIICSLCMKDGHYKDACPDEVLPGKSGFG